MIKKIKHKLKSNSGEGYIDTVLSVLFVMLAIVLAITTYGVLIRKQQAESATGELIRQIEVDGIWDSNEKAKVISILNSDGIKADNVECSVSGQIDEDQTFTLSLTINTSFGIGNFEVPIKLKTYATGHGEKYWKK